ncbi:MAG: hypothetical protein CL533_19345 [Afipia sp.]|nr:hypothetical protein [Afipia sp.]OUX59567.1 MAG: hypothetical protein CBB64_19295 [Afipia sp. TMED4]
MPPAGLRPRLSSSPTNSGRSFGTGFFHVAQRGREKKGGKEKCGRPSPPVSAFGPCSGLRGSATAWPSSTDVPVRRVASHLAHEPQPDARPCGPPRRTAVTGRDGRGLQRRFES